MKQNPAATNKLFLEILPDYISQEELLDVFSKSKLKKLIQGNIKTAFIVSSEPVESRIYLTMVNAFSTSGIQVMSFYFNELDLHIYDPLYSAVSELKKMMQIGGCLIVSYRSRLALPLIAGLHIQNGSSADEAIAAVTRIKNDASGLLEYRNVLARIQETSLRPAGDARHIRDAIMIERPGVKLQTAPATAQPARYPAEKTRIAPAAVAAGVAAGAGQAIPETGADGPRKKEKAQQAKERKPSGSSAVDVKHATGPFYRSIRFKLISIISFIIIASLTGMIFLASYFFKNDNKIRVQESNLQISEVIALKIKSEIEKYQIMASIMLKEKPGSITGEESLQAAGQKEILFAGIAKQSAKTGIVDFVKTFYNKPLMNKYIITESDVNALNDKKMFALSFSGEHCVNNASPYLDNPVFCLSFPYERDANGSVKTIIISYIRLDNLMKTFSTTGITSVFMVNYKGEIIAHPDASAVLKGLNYSSIPICGMMMKSKIDNGQTRYRDSKGVYYLGSYKKIDAGGFGIIATAQEAKAYEAVYDIQRRNMIIMAIVLTAAILIIFFFGKTITTPIIRLVGATKKIIEGQYHVDIAPTTRDEIGQLTSTFIEMGKGLEEREKIKSAFGKFVNKEIAEAAMRDELRLGGERKTVAILFSDIRQFTSISEKLEPEEVVEFLNIYMTKMVSCIEQSNGIVDKFIGDAIMAVWGTPISKGNDTENAINSALLMRQELIAFNKGRGDIKKPVIMIGCGINTGTVLAGQIGSENRMEYTVIGDAVNLASRIEGLNKPFGTDILISEDSYKLVKDIYAFEKMRQIKVKGKMEPQQIYAVLGRLDDPARPKSVKELQTNIGINVKEDMTEEALMQLIDHGEEKYEIIEK